MAIYCKVMGALVNVVLEYLINTSKRLYNITEDESHQLHVLFKSLWDLEKLFQFPSKKIKVTHCVSQWTKFSILSTIFESSMQEIVDNWNSDKMTMFTKEEVVFFIKALFSDSDQNLKLLIDYQW